MPVSPTQLSLKEMRERGYLCQVVEHWHFYAKRRIDLFGIIDIICIRDGETVGLQTTSYGCLSGHRKKIRKSDTLRPWLRAGNVFLLHGWRKIKGQHTLREQEFSMNKP